MKKYALPEYSSINKKLIDTLIPDYGLHMTTTRNLTTRGDELKQLYPSLNSWPSYILAEAEIHQEVLVRMHREMPTLPLPSFLEELFAPHIFAERPTKRPSLFFVSKKAHRDTCQKYEDKIFRLTSALEKTLSIQKHGVINGGPYKCALECRDIAREIKALTTGESALLSLRRLEYIEGWLLKLAAELDGVFPAEERDVWKAALQDTPAVRTYLA